MTEQLVCVVCGGSAVIAVRARLAPGELVDEAAPVKLQAFCATHCPPRSPFEVRR